MQTKEQHAHPPYMLIWGVLALMTLGKVLVSIFVSAKELAIALLIIIATVNALLVALYYMHLRFEPKKLWILAAIPLPLIAILLLVVLQEFPR